ncbi:hypothetical protein C9E85_16215 [Plesiomonas shigelloides]|uniref:hypothetical protein n=1 Tax=Plesiomonas shigelloides TaxID=703 RepID=UPI000D583DDF|nr:hypothetical protein [Plesiomonas shigelloides]PVU64821.1 hypothetical protein C9E85_16215 [Plesiomonas shigelloides]
MSAATSIDEGLEGDKLSRRRTLNFVTFNFSRYLSRSSNTEESSKAKRTSELYDGMKLAIDKFNHKDDKAEEYKHLKESLNQWLSVNTDQVLGVYRLFYHLVLEPISSNESGNYRPPLFNTYTELISFKCDGVFSLLSDFESVLDRTCYRNIEVSSKHINVLVMAINFLDMTNSLLKKSSFCVLNSLDINDEVSNIKACAILIRLSSVLGKPIGSLIKPIKYCAHEKIPLMGVELQEIFSFKNATERLQMVIDSIIIGEVVYWTGICSESELEQKVATIKNKIGAITLEVLGLSVDGVIEKFTPKVKLLADYNNLFFDYLRCNTFKDISGERFYTLYEQVAKEYDVAFNFFCVMATAFIDERDLPHELNCAKSAMDLRRKRKAQSRRAQMNVDVDTEFLERLNDFCEEHKMKKSEVVKKAVEAFISKSSR